MKKNLFNVFLVCVFCVAAISDVFAQQIKVTGKPKIRKQSQWQSQLQ